MVPALDGRLISDQLDGLFVALASGRDAEREAFAAQVQHVGHAHFCKRRNAL